MLMRIVENFDFKKKKKLQNKYRFGPITYLLKYHNNDRKNVTT